MTAPSGSVSVEVLRVFTDVHARHGNPLAVITAGANVGADAARLAETGTWPEVVVVDDRATLALRILAHDGREVSFAGHPLVGAGWLFVGDSLDVHVLRPPAGEVRTWRDQTGRQWIAAPAAWAPDVSLIEYDSPADVDRLSGPPPAVDFAYCWAWDSCRSGTVRARAFAPGLGVAEDEATGGAAIRLAAHLGRAITIVQGAGSVLSARPCANGHVELGGYVRRSGPQR